jgi:hypothetical protein
VQPEDGRRRSPGSGTPEATKSLSPRGRSQTILAIARWTQPLSARNRIAIGWRRVNHEDSWIGVQIWCVRIAVAAAQILSTGWVTIALVISVAVAIRRVVALSWIGHDGSSIRSSRRSLNFRLGRRETGAEGEHARGGDHKTTSFQYSLLHITFRTKPLLSIPHKPAKGRIWSSIFRTENGISATYHWDAWML